MARQPTPRKAAPKTKPRVHRKDGNPFRGGQRAYLEGLASGLDARMEAMQRGQDAIGERLGDMVRGILQEQLPGLVNGVIGQVLGQALRRSLNTVQVNMPEGTSVRTLRVQDASTGSHCLTRDGRVCVRTHAGLVDLGRGSFTYVTHETDQDVCVLPPGTVVTVNV